MKGKWHIIWPFTKADLQAVESHARGIHMSQSQARRFFFICTDDAVARMAELFDFVWPSVTALVFARSKAHRYRGLIGEARRQALIKAFQSERVIQKQYRSISGLKRASLGKALIDTSWSEQEQVFARLVLVNIFAIHEGWLDDLMDELIPNRRQNAAWSKIFIVACQFPFRNSKHEDWSWAMAELNNHRSAGLEACFGSKLRSGRLYSDQQAIPLLICYRYFKELRNSVVHRNGKASQALVDAHNAYQRVANPTSLQISGSPPQGTLNQIVVGGDVKLSLFGVVGFNDVVLRLMATLDVEAGLTDFGEGTMARFFRGRTNVRSASGDRDTTLRRMANEYGLAGLEQPSKFAQVLANQGVAVP
jgi:hypothetical protein